MEQLIIFFSEKLPAFIWGNRILVLTVVFLVGFLANLAGEVIRKKGFEKLLEQAESGTQSEAPAMDFPYKYVAGSLTVLGMMFMILAAILLYFAGGYNPALEKLGLIEWMS